MTCSTRLDLVFWHFLLSASVCVLFPQDAQCGEGTRVRNISCVVFDGSIEDVGKVVDEEFCGEIEPIIDGNKKIILEETCTVPCPGNKAIQMLHFKIGWVSLQLSVPSISHRQLNLFYMLY